MSEYLNTFSENRVLHAHFWTNTKDAVQTKPSIKMRQRTHKPKIYIKKNYKARHLGNES